MAQPRRRSVWPTGRLSLPPRGPGNLSLMIAIVAAIVGVVVLGTLACTALVNYAVEDGAGDPPVRPTPSTEIPTAATGLNRTVRDGRLAFAVTAVECGIDRVGDDVLNEQAEGQFCQVSLTVTNHGDEARTFFGTTQYAYDAAGQKHEIDSAGMIYLDEEISLPEASPTLFWGPLPGGGSRMRLRPREFP